MCLFEVIYVVYTLFENINFADYIQFAFDHPAVSYSFNLDNDEQLHIDSYSPWKLKLFLRLFYWRT